MYRAHELIAALNKDSQDYKDCMSAIKFDLGELSSLIDMSEISSRQMFHELPAPICLFQFVHDLDIYFLLATKTESGSSWKKYGRQQSDGFRWHVEDICLFVEQDKMVLRRASNSDFLGEISEASDSLISEYYEKLNLSEKWSLHRFFECCCAIEVFSCNNVVTVDNHPPKFINDKRKKKGKVPFFSYKTIHITGTGSASESKGTGTHASPRLHLRRGHIRRLADGRKVWVSSCLVGDKTKGFVAKDYVVGLNNEA